MPELIDRLQTIQQIKNTFCSECDCEYGDASCKVCEYDFCIGILNEQPTIEAKPVRRGRWIQYIRNADETYIECSNCCVASRLRHLQMVTRTGSGLPDYCPNCGARMDGGADNG